MRRQAGDVQLAGGIAGHIGKNAGEVFFQKIDLQIGDVGSDIDGWACGRIGIDEYVAVQPVVLVIGMQGGVDGTGCFLVVAGQVQAADGVIGKAELIGLAMEGDRVVAKGIRHVDAAGKQSFQPFCPNQVRGEVADVDLLQLDMDVVPIAFPGRSGGQGDTLIVAMDIKAIRHQVFMIEGQLTVLVDMPDLAVDIEAGRIEGDPDAVGHGLDPGRDIGGVQGMGCGGRYLDTGQIVGTVKVYAGGREMQAVVEIDLADAGLHGKAIQAAPAFQTDVVESDGLIAEGRNVHAEVQQVLAGVDPTVDTRVVEPMEILVEHVDILV